MIRLDAPYWFLLLIIIPVIIIYHTRKPGRAGVRFSSTNKVARLHKSLRQQLLFLPLLLRITALVLLIVALARPQLGKDKVKDISKGIAIEMVVDRSGSMQTRKDIGRESLSRLEIVKRAFTEFVSGKGGKLPGRPNDLIGMITFARYPDTLCPLTLSHGALLKFIETVKVVEIQSENSTAIGDALLLAGARLKNAEQSFSGADNAAYEIKSKVIILLTDGEDTGVGKTAPMEAVKTIKEWGFKIYTIGLAGSNWYNLGKDLFGGTVKVQAGSGVNTAMLEQMAKETGGIFKLAEDINSLMDVYREIDTLEKSEVSSERYLNYNELFLPFALAGLLFLVLEFVLNCTLLRRIP